MDIIQLRLTCVQLALQEGLIANEVLKRAEELYQFIIK